MLTKDWLRIRYNVCESCGIAGGFTGSDVMVTDCGSCGQVYREGYSDVYTTKANGCRMVDVSATLTNTLVAADCIDVYGTANSWKDNNSTGVHQARVCRCSRKNLTCTSCASGACD